MIKIRKWVSSILECRSETGTSLVEALVAIGILGGGVLTMILAMSGGALAVQENDREVTAQSLARTELEYIKSCVYDPNATTYPTVSAPDGYSIAVSVSAVPDTDEEENIQKVTVAISRGGAAIMTVADYKVQR